MPRNDALSVTRKNALACLRDGRLQDAKILFQHICDTAKRDAEAWFFLGAINGQLGSFDEAIACNRTSIAIKPDYIDAHYNLAQAHAHQNDFEAAIASYREVLRLYPRHTAAFFNLGYALQRLGRHEEATTAYKQALLLDPENAEVLNNLGNAWHGMGRSGDALTCYEKALCIKPDYAEAYCNLGWALHTLGDNKQAAEKFRHALELQPSYAEARTNLGYVLQCMSFYEEAVQQHREALEFKPDDVDILNNLGVALLSTGRVAEAITSFRQVLTIQPDSKKANACLLFSLNYLPADMDSVFRAHKAWGSRQSSLTPVPAKHKNPPDPSRRLRIGYVSSDLRLHSVAYFIEPLLAHHDPSVVESFCYSNVENPDSETKHLQSLAGAWRDIHSLSDAQVAESVTADQIDILVDLDGHTGNNNRLLAFARKPAPVQVTYLGYPNTTGLPTIDYRLTDAWADPPGQTEAWHTEALFRLPHGFLCYQPPLGAPDVGPLPMLQKGHITFGSFNNLGKISDTVISVWAELLTAIPNAHLILKNMSLQDPITKERYQLLFEQEGVSSDRVELIGFLPQQSKHLALYNRIDVALDTFPYNGTTTTCEALWMGVPVVTLAGLSHAGRVGVSLLSQVGLTDFIATDPDDYVTCAVRWANDREKLSQLRAEMRARLASSSLCDGHSFARDVESAYREMWLTWCARQLT